jgi:hypothetical protein
MFMSVAASTKEVHETVVATTDEVKAEYIITKLKDGPVLVYCDEHLLENLKRRTASVVQVTIGNVPESAFLRTMLDTATDKGMYPLLVATDMFGMRGLDYRSRKVAMHLIIAKSFDTERGAL